MPTETTIGGASPGLTFRRGTLASVTVALAVLTSTIVLSEPALADVLMMGVVLAVPILGAGRAGRVTLLNMAAWLVIGGLGIAGTALSANFDTALKHQLVTLYLAAGAVAIAAYVAADPLPRFTLVMWCYVLACLVATFAAIAGYFDVVPGTYDLFTEYDRARGTFKDPNVFGAALVPAMTFLAWIMLRERPLRALLAAAIALPLAIGLLISFSRGAWVSAALAVLLLAWVVFVRSRRHSDFQRFGVVVMIGTLGLLVALGAAIQAPKVRALLEQRANMDQSYDQGPEGRFGGQEKARRLILDQPLGIGTHTFRDVHHPEEPHNVYLTMFLNAGWLGGLLYIASVVGTVMAGLWMSLRNGYLQGPMVVASTSFAALAFEGIIIDSDHWRHFFLVMALVWGLADADVARRPARVRRDGDPEAGHG